MVCKIGTVSGGSAAPCLCIYQLPSLQQAGADMTCCLRQGLEPKKAPPPDLLRRLFGYPDPEAAAVSSVGAEALQQTSSRRRGGAQFAEPVPGDFAYSGEQPPLAGRSTKPPTPRRLNAVNRGAARPADGRAEHGAQTSTAEDWDEQPRELSDQPGEDVEGLSTPSEQQDGVHPHASRASAHCGEYDIITGKYAEPQPGDFGYEAPREAKQPRPAGRVSVRSIGARRQRHRGDSGRTGGGDLLWFKSLACSWPLIPFLFGICLQALMFNYEDLSHALHSSQGRWKASMSSPSGSDPFTWAWGGTSPLMHIPA